MIQILTGKIGAGKTLHAVEFIYEALIEGRTIATNIELVYDKLAYLALKEKGVLIREDQIIHLDLNADPNWHQSIPWGIVGKTVLVVLDEIHLFFNSRDYAKTDKNHRSMLSFLSQSRKACVDVLFVAQVASQVEKQFRNQAKNEIYINDFGNFHLPLVGRVPLRQNILTTKDLDTGMKMRVQKRDYPKKFFGAYNTYAFLDDDMQLASSKSERLEPYKLHKPKGSEKRQLLQKLNGNEILDNTNGSARRHHFWPLEIAWKFWRLRRAERKETNGANDTSADKETNQADNGLQSYG
ncbi:hypothetical protein HW115_01410 [Verrucomicrobiaceae bacterium N1E253]|uniref:Zona occludens toxin N-terminal domain-containing protein n=1 Tax=Oceaniferula marina TaxID=2748318 RepID=A0A851GBC4_9BACT|nr:zonular occludens toxin domain-containing protein [Oceaniferula marina]NWK54252.1 hypothetical protein [Oceaniferula marina]